MAKEEVTPQAPIMVLSEDLKSDLAKMPTAQRIKFLQKVSEYVGAPTEDTNKFLNVEFEACGILIHRATINSGTKKDIDPDSGELTEKPIYTEANRTVIKMKDGKLLGFVAMSIENYARDFLITAFGMGDWVDEDGSPIYVKMKVTQTESKGGRAYSIQVL